MRLTPSRRKWLHFALALAIAWKESLEQATTPDYGRPARGEQAKTIAACRRNVKRFKALQALLQPEGGAAWRRAPK